MKAVEELGYVLDDTARSLSSRKTGFCWSDRSFDISLEIFRHGSRQAIS